MKKLFSILLSVVMLTSITAGLDLTAYGDETIDLSDCSYSFLTVKSNDIEYHFGFNLYPNGEESDSYWSMDGYEFAGYCKMSKEEFDSCSDFTKVDFEDGIPGLTLNTEFDDYCLKIIGTGSYTGIKYCFAENWLYQAFTYQFVDFDFVKTNATQINNNEEYKNSISLENDNQYQYVSYSFIPSGNKAYAVNFSEINTYSYGIVLYDNEGTRLKVTSDRFIYPFKANETYFIAVIQTNNYTDSGNSYYNLSVSDTDTTKGNCGDTVTWSYDESDLEFTLSGSGETKDFDKGQANEYPEWYDAYASNVEKIIIEDGITKIGYSLFYKHTALKEITIPKSITEISGSVFYGCTSLTDVYYNGTKSEWNNIEIDDYGNDCLINATIHYTDSTHTPTPSTPSADNGNIQNTTNNTPQVGVSGNNVTTATATDNVPAGAKLINGEYIATAQKNTKIAKLKKGKKSATVQWKKVKGVKGYQVQVATNKKFTKNKKTVTVKKQKTTKTTIKKLKSNKKYYVRIRTYKVVDGKKVYSKWSKVKTVKTK